MHPEPVIRAPAERALDLHCPTPLAPSPAAYTASLQPFHPGTVPAVTSIVLPDGRVVTGYTLTPPQPEPTPAPASSPVPAWARTTALLAPTIGGGIAATGIGLSYAAPGLTAMSQLLWPIAALTALIPLAAAALLRTVRGRADHQPPAPVVQNITATGLFGRATGTINHR
ncbi:hypothetical protein ABZ419_01470 [Streptomyces cinnamoneus]|uniref:hypothetical protein n=1 Tax=Streptomyces cinnamoneus TaxID=53446 RepID=UPI0033CBCC00